MSMPDSLSGWLEYIGSQHPSDMELGLGRIKQVADTLGLQEFNCPVITVAGTNGKGSSVAMLESVYTAAGYRTAAYTSPHLTVFNERIRIGKRFCSDQALCDAFEQVDASRRDIPLTYFEFATLAGLIIFAASKPDVVILEVGLGGRLDAVNILAPDVALITSVGIDHADWLGDDREQIGREKAGIIHPTSIAVIADPDPPASVIDAANRTAIARYRLNQEFRHEISDTVWNWLHGQMVIQDLPCPPGAGRAQYDNAAGVLMVLSALQSRLPLDDQLIRTGLSQVELAGRFQVIAGEPMVILDVAHNEDSVALLAENLDGQICTGRTLAVCGMLADKEIGKTTGKLMQLVDAWYVGGLDAARTAQASDIALILQQTGASDIKDFERIESAWQAARDDAQRADRIVVFGSFHTVGAIIEYLSFDQAQAVEQTGQVLI